MSGMAVVYRLFPVARRLGPRRAAAMSGRKIHGPWSLAVGPAEPEETVASPAILGPE
jgi:hypothetical protein